MEIWFECTTSGQRCAAEVGEGCSAADLQERAVAVLYPQSVVSAEAVGLCVDGADGEVLAPEVLIAHTALCAGGTVYVSRRKQDSSGVWVPRRYVKTSPFQDVCEDTLLVGGERAFTINLVTTEVTPLPGGLGPLCKEVVLMPHHIVYCSENYAVHFRPRDSGAEVVVHMRDTVQSVVAMRVTETVLIGTCKQIVQYSCEGVKMRTIDRSGCSFAVSPCETLFLNTVPSVVVHRLDTPELSVMHGEERGLLFMQLSLFLASGFRPSFSPDASLAVMACANNYSARTIDIVSGRILCALRSGRPLDGACFSACSRYLFTSSLWSVKQWDARSGAPMGRIHNDSAQAVHASTDGCRLVIFVRGGISVLDIAALNAPLHLQRNVVATESRCSGCVCS